MTSHSSALTPHRTQLWVRHRASGWHQQRSTEPGTLCDPKGEWRCGSFSSRSQPHNPAAENKPQQSRHSTCAPHMYNAWAAGVPQLCPRAARAGTWSRTAAARRAGPQHHIAAQGCDKPINVSTRIRSAQEQRRATGLTRRPSLNEQLRCGRLQHATRASGRSCACTEPGQDNTASAKAAHHSVSSAFSLG